MSQYDNSNSGMIFKNDKGDNPKRPDYKGQQNCVCPHCNKESEYWISGWVRVAGETSKRPGEKFISTKLEPKEQQAPARQAPAPQADLTDDVPF